MDQFMILFKTDNDDTLYALDFGWIIGGSWTQAKRDDDVSKPDLIDEYGRAVLMQHFGIVESPSAPSLADITAMSPRRLMALGMAIDPHDYLKDDTRPPVRLMVQEHLLVAA